METLKIITDTYETGAFWETAEGANVGQGDLKNLRLTDQVVKDALRTRSRMQVTEYAPASFRAHGRAPDFDGEMGPAMEAMLQAPRCHVPDFAPPPGVDFLFDDPAVQEVAEKMQREAKRAQGDGNWRGCHSVGNYHCAVVLVNQSGMRDHLKAIFVQMLTHTQQKYAGIGLLLIFVDKATKKDLITGEDRREEAENYQTELTYVQRSRGWIGLAIVGNNETCVSRAIWLQILATFVGRDVFSAQCAVHAHEIGHNVGMGHFPGSANIMNPSIIERLPTNIWPESDSSTPWLRRKYGGEPVPIDGPVPPDDPDPPVPPPPGGLEGRVEQLEKLLDAMDSRIDDQAVKDTIHSAAIQYLLSKQQQ